MVSLVFFVLFFIHVFNLWGIKLDSIGLTLVIIPFLILLTPWLRSIFKTIRVPGGLSFTFRDQAEAIEHVEVSKEDIIDKRDKVIDWNKQISTTKESAPNDRNVLFLKARINYSHEAGSMYLMRIRVNGEFLREKHLVNKSPIKKIMDGREHPWFSSEYDSWTICYSPDFKANYFHRRYKVLNGDPYIFVFDLSAIRKKEGNKYEIVVEHNGLEGNEAYKNSIIVRDIGVC